MARVPDSGRRAAGVDIPPALEVVQLRCPDVNRPRSPRRRLPNDTLVTVVKVLKGIGAPYFDAVVEGKGEVELAVAGNDPRVRGVDIANGSVRHVFKPFEWIAKFIRRLSQVMRFFEVFSSLFVACSKKSDLMAPEAGALRTRRCLGYGNVTCVSAKVI